MKSGSLIHKNNLKIVNIFNIPIFSGSKDEVLTLIKGVLARKKENFWIATVNPEFVMNACKDRDFNDILQKTNLNVIDGVGLAWAVKRKTGKRPEIVAGSDLVDDLCRLSRVNNWNIYFLGGFGDRSKRTAEYFKKKYKTKVAGSYCGLAIGEDEKILKELKGKKIDILLVAYGMKRQEEWIVRNLSKLKVGMVMGVGRSFDYYSGDLKRAPIFWRKFGLEWFYSLIRQPSRIKRQLVLPKFFLKVLFQARG
jgi:N-acetylglucosaminyldiphosphoundecaprenol N-acetyl-beta-D-mannosaminyltransferase